MLLWHPFSQPFSSWRYTYFGNLSEFIPKRLSKLPKGADKPQNVSLYAAPCEISQEICYIFNIAVFIALNIDNNQFSMRCGGSVVSAPDCCPKSRFQIDISPGYGWLLSIGGLPPEMALGHRLSYGGWQRKKNYEEGPAVYIKQTRKGLNSTAVSIVTLKALSKEI